MNGIPIFLPPTPSTSTELQHLRKLRRKMLTDDTKYPKKKGVYKPSAKARRDYSLMRLINKRLYQLTGNDMYLWLGGHYKELQKIKNG